MTPEEIQRVKDLLPTTLGSEETRGTIAAKAEAARKALIEEKAEAARQAMERAALPARVAEIFAARRAAAVTNETTVVIRP